MQTIQRIIEIPLQELQTGEALTKDITLTHCCIICGKKLKDNIDYKMVHLLENGNIVSYSGSDIIGSQGFFPIGNECKKHLIIQFAF